MADLEKNFPQRLNDIVRWFKFYKTFDGKKPNVIHFGEKILSVERTLEIIHENHIFWKELRECVSQPSSKYQSEYGKKLIEKAKSFRF